MRVDNNNDFFLLFSHGGSPCGSGFWMFPYCSSPPPPYLGEFRGIIFRMQVETRRDVKSFKHFSYHICHGQQTYLMCGYGGYQMSHGPKCCHVAPNTFEHEVFKNDIFSDRNIKKMFWCGTLASPTLLVLLSTFLFLSLSSSPTAIFIQIFGLILEYAMHIAYTIPLIAIPIIQFKWVGTRTYLYYICIQHHSTIHR